MKKATFTMVVVLAIAGIFMSSTTQAQQDKSQRPSPPAKATGTINGANIIIDYSSPSVKGRKIWGDLVPYGKVWRAGANEATIFETDKDIKVEGKTLPKGKYSLYAIPGENEWVIIFNSATGQWGINRDYSTTQDPAKDVLRVNVKPKKSAAPNEKLMYTVDGKGFALKWENLEVPVSIS